MTDFRKKQREPFFNFTEKAPAALAGVLIALFFLFGLIPGLVYLIAPFTVLRPFGFIGASLPEQILSLLGHAFLHGDMMHIFMNAMMITVLGIATVKSARLKSVSRGRRRSPSLVFLTVFIFGVVVGGLSQWAWWGLIGASIGANAPAAIGASGGASALLATAGWAIGGRDKMLQFAMGWSLINAIMVFLGPLIGLNIAWAAHIGGFIGGMLLAQPLLKANGVKLGL